MLTNIFELTTRYDSRKSFYGKAMVEEYDDGHLVLRSYGTRVAEITPEGKYISYGSWSQTTSRHQREFEKQFAR